LQRFSSASNCQAFGIHPVSSARRCFVYLPSLDSDENRGAIKLDRAFPREDRYRGYLQLLNDCGESLIDYDAHIESIDIHIGIGIC
jgi:outer membrane phospholipase A